MVLHRAKVYCEHMLIIRMVQCTIDMIWFCPNSREFTPKVFNEEKKCTGEERMNFYIA